MSAILRKISLWLCLIAILWAPFPIGGEMFWAPGLQEILVALAFLCWGLSRGQNPGQLGATLRPVAFPLVLALLALLWVWVQMRPEVPETWKHPLWPMTAELLGKPLAGAISLDVWRTGAEALKLLSYIMICLVSYDLARQDRTASRLTNTVVVTVALYAAYGFVLFFLDVGHRDFFFHTQTHVNVVSGPFVLRNSFATFCGLGTLAALAKIVSRSGEAIIFHRGWKPFAFSALQFVLGYGFWYLLAFIVCFAGVVGSASRAGFVATCGGLVTFAVLLIWVGRSRMARGLSGVFAVLVVAPIFGFILWHGATLSMRLQTLFDPSVSDLMRLSLWDAAERMIRDAPWLGLGLGTFQDAYPLYATEVFPHTVIRAHCDYLEFIAGVGIPAAILWFWAQLCLTGRFLRGVRIRRRNTVYPMLGLSALVLVGLHSAVDFSLQMSSVALIFAVLLGIACAQSLPGRQRQETIHLSGAANIR